MATDFSRATEQEASKLQKDAQQEGGWKSIAKELMVRFLRASISCQDEVEES